MSAKVSSLSELSELSSLLELSVSVSASSPKAISANITASHTSEWVIASVGMVDVRRERGLIVCELAKTYLHARQGSHVGGDRGRGCGTLAKSL